MSQLIRKLVQELYNKLSDNQVLNKTSFREEISKLFEY